MGVHVGIDVSKRHFDWVLAATGSVLWSDTQSAEVSRVPNSAAGVRRLVAELGRIELASVIVESTGGYERALLDALGAAGLPVALVNPWRVRRFGEGHATV